VPSSQLEYSAPGPPSLHCALPWYWQVLEQIRGEGGGRGGAGGNGGGGDDGEVGGGKGGKGGGGGAMGNVKCTVLVLV